jgi:ABC-type phosphate transport system substrate-binding protein
MRNPRAKTRTIALWSTALLIMASLALGTSRQAGVQAQADDGVVIVLNARNPTQTLSPADISKIFLGRTAFWHGVVPVKVMVRPDGSAAAKAFYGSVLKMTPQAFRKHWDELQLSGRGVAPKAYAAAEEMAQSIAQSPGGIGFALTSEVWKIQNKGMKVVNIR